MSRPGIFSWVMPIAGDQFKGGYFGTTVAVTDGTVDVSKGSVFTLNVGANTTLSFTGVPSGGAACFTLVVEGGGNYTVTWPSSVAWSGGEAPELSSGTDLLSFLTADGGNTWYGAIVVSDAA